MNKGLIKKLIVICLIIIICIIILIVLLKNNQKVVNQEISEKGVEEAQEIDTEMMIGQEEQERFYTVAECVSNYLDIINSNDQRYIAFDENKEMITIGNQNKTIYSILSDKYIKENNITEDNVKEFVLNSDSELIFIPLKMSYVQNEQDENLYQYIVYGYIANSYYELQQYINIIVNLDVNNMTFSIEPIEGNTEDIEKVKLECQKEKIKQNDYNTFLYQSLNDEYIITTYLDYYKKMTIGNPELAYQYLDDEYREKRFGTLDNFKEYVSKNEKDIRLWKATKYLVEYKSDYKEYVCQDKYENVYIFQYTAPMTFKTRLDTYTIPTEKFVDTYKKSDTKKKVMMNIDKWIQMLNNRDYKAAYNVLDENYRNNTFGDVEQFEKVMREKLPSHYKIEYSDFSEENETYLLDVKLTDITKNDSSKINISTVMQLKENLDFVMSFSFQE